MRVVAQQFYRPFSAIIAALLTMPIPLNATAADHGPRVARMLWQDHERGTLMWGEVHAGQKWVITASPVKGFPKLDAEKQLLGQMQQAEGFLLAGVRDIQNGTFQSGWVAVDTGVREQPHGDHSHWNFIAFPAVRGNQLNAEQGNPAQVSLYNGVFYVAHDGKLGFTRISPKDLASKPAKDCEKFFATSGNVTALAAVNNSLAYSALADADGQDSGRLDVVNLKAGAGGGPAYSVSLPTGGIAHATVNSGKVFFAAAGGVYWVDADSELKRSAETVMVNQLLQFPEAAAENLKHSGFFANHRNWVLFTTSVTGGRPALCLVDASAAHPGVVTLPIDMGEGLSLTPPKAVLASGGKRYAFFFQDKLAGVEGEIQEQLTVVDLDPNGDRNLSDARIAKTIPVGASKADGKNANHSLSFDSEGRLACFTNPGEGTIWVMSVRDLTIRAKGLVGGFPGEIVALGAPEHKH